MRYISALILVLLLNCGAYAQTPSTSSLDDLDMGPPAKQTPTNTVSVPTPVTPPVTSNPTTQVPATASDDLSLDAPQVDKPNIKPPQASSNTNPSQPVPVPAPILPPSTLAPPPDPSVVPPQPDGQQVLPPSTTPSTVMGNTGAALDTQKDSTSATNTGTVTPSATTEPNLAPPADMPQPFNVPGSTVDNTLKPKVIVKGAMLQEDTERQRLEEQDLGTFLYNEADFTTVLRALANRAGMNFIAPNGITQKVSFAIAGVTPFQAMNMITESQGFSLVFDAGAWQVRAQNDAELVSRIYQIQYNVGEIYDDSGSIDTGASAQGLPQTAANRFKVQPPKMLDNIKQILGIKTEGFEALDAGTASVKDSTNTPVFDPSGNFLGNVPNSPERQQQVDQLQNAARLQQSPSEAGVKSNNNASYGGRAANGSQVIYNPDDNTFFVVATRQQQGYVLEYLRSADKPQPLVAIEARFFESSKDPAKTIGFDWSGTLGNGYTVSLKNLSASINAESISRFTFAPSTAILSASDLSVTMNAFLTDQDTLTVSYPRQVTSNNREVCIRSVIEEPVLSASTSVSVSGSTGNTQSVTYLPIGTVINILPRVNPDGVVKLRTTIAVSSILSEAQVAGNTYPVATTRLYSGECYVQSGYTLAIGGLEETDQNSNFNKVPVLGDIPFFGYFFRNRSDSKLRKNLMIFLTPTVLDSYKGGIREIPETVADTRANENDMDTAYPNAKRFIEADGGGLIVPKYIDESIDNAIHTPSDPRAELPERQLFKEIDGQSSLPVNPRLYDFNHGQIIKNDDGTYTTVPKVDLIIPASDFKVKPPVGTDLSQMTLSELNALDLKYQRASDRQYEQLSVVDSKVTALGKELDKAEVSDGPDDAKLRQVISDKKEAMLDQKSELKRGLTDSLNMIQKIYTEKVLRLTRLANYTLDQIKIPGLSYVFTNEEVSKLQGMRDTQEVAKFNIVTAQLHARQLRREFTLLRKGFDKVGRPIDAMDEAQQQLSAQERRLNL